MPANVSARLRGVWTKVAAFEAGDDLFATDGNKKPRDIARGFASNKEMSGKLKTQSCGDLVNIRIRVSHSISARKK